MDYLFKAWKGKTLETEQWCSLAQALKKATVYEADGYRVTIQYLNGFGELKDYEAPPEDRD